MGLDNYQFTSSDLLKPQMQVVSDDESLGSKLSREAHLLAAGMGQGFVQEASTALDRDHLGSTAFKFAGSMALGITMTYLTKGAGLRRAIGQAAGSTMTVAFLGDLANKERLLNLSGAIAQTWKSGENFDSSLKVVKNELGPLAFDMTLMGAGGALGAYSVASGRLSATSERFSKALKEQAGTLAASFEPFMVPKPAFAMAGAEASTYPLPRPVPSVAAENVMAMSTHHQRPGGIVPPYLKAEARPVQPAGKLVPFDSLPPALVESGKLANGVPGQEKVAATLQELFTQRAKSPIRVEVVEIPPGTVGDRAFKTDALFVVVQPSGQVTTGWPVDFSFAHKEFLPHVMKLDHRWFLYDSQTGALSGMIKDKVVTDAVWSRAMEFMKRPGIMQAFKRPVALEWLQRNRHDLEFSMQNSVPRLNL